MFKGSMVAIATPMNEDGSLDFASFERLIEFELIKHSDYDSVDPTLYDKDLCLIPTKVLELGILLLK